MILDAVVNDEGTLTAKVPAYLSGKKIQIVIKDKNKPWSNWNAIAAVLSEADRMEVPRRRVNEIIEEIRDLRESK